MRCGGEADHRGNRGDPLSAGSLKRQGSMTTNDIQATP